MMEDLRLSPNEMQVIYERHHGWEKASYSLLSAIFGVSPKVIGRICRDHTNAAPKS